MDSRHLTELLDQLEERTLIGIGLYQDVKAQLHDLAISSEKQEEKSSVKKTWDEEFKPFLDNMKKILNDYDQDPAKNIKYKELNETLEAVQTAFNSPDNKSQITSDLKKRKDALILNCSDFFDEVGRAYNVYNMLEYDYNLGKRAEMRRQATKKASTSTAQVTQTLQAHPVQPTEKLDQSVISQADTNTPTVPQQKTDAIDDQRRSLLRR